jgi:hypothetical protein
MRHFCLMTSENYIAKSIVMYKSLLNIYGDGFRLYYFCFDQITYDFLVKANYRQIIPVSMKEWEDSELLSVKGTRTTAEYFFTTTGSLILHVLNEFHVDMCIYLDADLYFYSTPEVLLEEMGNATVMITEHRYSDPDLARMHGKYCVQFMPFRNDENGIKILKWWRNACIDWCYMRSENGRWADQGYLNDWTERFEGVHELSHLGGGVASWNAARYKFSRKRSNGKISLREKGRKHKSDLVFYHFHGVRFYNNNHIYFENDSADRVLLKNIYRPYFKELVLTTREIQALDPSIKPLGILPAPPKTWKTPFQVLKKKLKHRLVTDLEFN